MKLLLNGLIGTNYDGDIIIGEDEFSNAMFNFAKRVGLANEHHKGLGGERAIIDNCQIRMFFTKTLCELDEAENALLVKLYGMGYSIAKDGEEVTDNEHTENLDGEFQLKTNFLGYSEYTITGYEVETCTLGGHNLLDILKSHIGQYVNIVVNAE